MQTPSFQIVQAKPWHCGAMARRLRPEHRQAVAMLGIDAHYELRDRFDDSAFRRAWLVDGQLAALGGVTGPAAAATGLVWLAVGFNALHHPVSIAREAQRQIVGLMRMKRELVTTLLPGDHAAMRMAVFLGFRPMSQNAGKWDIPRGPLVRDIERDPDLRVPIGRGYGIVVSYREAA